MAQPSSEEFNLSSYVMHHVVDSQEWHLPFLPTIHFPEPVSLHVTMMLIASFLMFILFILLYNKKSKVPRGLTNCLEVFVLFVRDEICVTGMGEKDGKKMAPIFCTFFFFIVFQNLIGLIPGFATATGNLGVTFGLASTTLFFMIFMGIYKNGPIGFIKAFIPHGVPFPILLILTPVEILSMFVKSAALMIRLCANMLAGHIVILSLIGTVAILGLPGAPLLLLVLFLYFLEIFIALLQAYIFTLFSAIFIGQLMHPEH